MEDDKLPHVTVAKKNEKTVAAPPFPLPGVRGVIMWALINAGHAVFSIVYALTRINQQAPSWLLPHLAGAMKTADAKVVDLAGALVTRLLWCVVSEAAAGALALMLPRHRRQLRLLLAYAALVATAASHTMWAGLHGVFVTFPPGGLCFETGGVTTAVIFIFEVVDLICFLGLYRLRVEAWWWNVEEY